MKKSIFVGTYTTNESNGIYQLDLDLETKSFTENLAYEIENPTYVVLSNNKKNLYSIAKHGNKGGIASFSIDKQTKNITLLNTYLEDGKHPCHLTVNKAQTLLFVAYYHQGKIQVHTILPDGSIGEMKEEIYFAGKGPNKERQQSSHIHYVGLSLDENYLFVTDLGADKVSVYKITEDKLLLTSIYHAKSGSGPRHIAIHPNGKLLFLFTELSSEVITLSFNNIDGEILEINSIVSLPDIYSGENTGSAIRLTPNGEYLFVGNRGLDRISAYKVNDIDGTLSLVSSTSTEGEHPRDFHIDPTGEYLIVANMHSNNLVVFQIDQETGILTKINLDITLPDPVSIEFI